jgi:hypothetical protein
VPSKVIVHDGEDGAHVVAVSVRQTDDGHEVVTVEITTGKSVAAAPAPSPFDEIDALDAEIDARSAARSEETARA